MLLIFQLTQQLNYSMLQILQNIESDNFIGAYGMERSQLFKYFIKLIDSYLIESVIVAKAYASSWSVNLGKKTINFRKNF